MRYDYGGTADIGFERESQEDFIQFKELDTGTLLCVIADGTGSMKERPQPATIVAMEIVDNISLMYSERKDLLLSAPAFFLKMAMLNANSVLGGFKVGNEELYSGYAASVTCCLLTPDGMINVAHSGNTRLYILRGGNTIRQLTMDHTKAAALLARGDIDIETYHVHPDRLKITSGIGVIDSPEIQEFSGMIKENDIILMTTDGIHYAIQPEAITDIILQSSECIQATASLVDAAKNIVKYPDNMSAILVHCQPDS